MNGAPLPPENTNSPFTADPAALAAADERRQTVLARMAAACAQAGRPAADVQLLAVSKTFDAPHCLAMAAAGQRSFGENYLQEALAKQEWMRAHWHEAPLQWHFIGPIQSNKTRPIAEHFDWVHTVDRLRIGQRLSDQRPATLAPLQICLQVNIDEEDTKSGCTPDEAPELAAQLAALPRLGLRGLMAIPAASEDPAQQRAAFARLRVLRDQCQTAIEDSGQADAAPLDTLSMGMTGDLEAAVAEGATIVRVGTALFGVRPKPAAG